MGHYIKPKGFKIYQGNHDVNARSRMVFETPYCQIALDCRVNEHNINIYWHKEQGNEYDFEQWIEDHKDRLGLVDYSWNDRCKFQASYFVENLNVVEEYAFILFADLIQRLLEVLIQYQFSLNQIVYEKS